jgi:hypothetical protein
MEDGAAPSGGTAAGLIAFLDYMIKHNEMVEATASSFRTACRRVLETEGDLDALDLRDADLDAIVRRFRNKYRASMKIQSIDTYEQRFRDSVTMYRKWLNDEPDWRPKRRRRAPTSNGSPSARSAGRQARVPETQASVATQINNEAAARLDVGRPSMITYPFPIRPGLQGTITLPEDLSRREAKRISAFVAALVSEDEDDGPPHGEQPEQHAVPDRSDN